MQWNYTELDKTLIDNLSKQLDLQPVITALVLRHKIEDLSHITKFLNPKLSDLSDPFEITNLKPAVERIVRAIENKENILILGDYDVDGVTSTTILVSALNKFGLSPQYTIPRRLEEGYGCTQAVIDRALQDYTPSLFISLDCGNNSPSEMQYVLCRNIDCIVIDHHKASLSLPKEVLLVNPHVFDTPDKPWFSCCTAGLVFKFVHGILKLYKTENHPLFNSVDIRELLDLVALGTVADLVPLIGENRILISFGLKKIHNSQRAGIQALCEASGLNGSPIIQPVDVAFKLGPRINASGRLADARLPVDMLLSSNFAFCYRAASELNTINRERQDIERAVTDAAEAMVRQSNTLNPTIVAYSPDWHQGVVGIVAGKLSKSYHRPTIILTQEGPSLIKRSGRSVQEVNLIQALSDCAHLLTTWGGHPMAAGLSFPKANLQEFAILFNAAVEKQLNGQALTPSLKIAYSLLPHELTDKLLDAMQSLQPFGMGNSEPVFEIRDAILPAPAIPFSNQHIRFQIKRDPILPLAGVGWRMAENPPPHSTPLHLAVRFAYNYWNGLKTPQLELIDWKFAD